MVWSPDGHWLVLRTDNGAAGAGDLVGVRSSGDTTPVPLVASSFTELEPSISPDSRWLAYTSNESGANEVYVRPFPGAAGARWQVSTGGGAQPRWSPDGRELFFLDGTAHLMAAQVRPGATFGNHGASAIVRRIRIRESRLPPELRRATGRSGILFHAIQALRRGGGHDFDRAGRELVHRAPCAHRTLVFESLDDPRHQMHGGSRTVDRAGHSGGDGSAGQAQIGGGEPPAGSPE